MLGEAASRVRDVVDVEAAYAPDRARPLNADRSASRPALLPAASSKSCSCSTRPGRRPTSPPSADADRARRAGRHDGRHGLRMTFGGSGGGGGVPRPPGPPPAGFLRRPRRAGGCAAGAAAAARGDGVARRAAALAARARAPRPAAPARAWQRVSRRCGRRFVRRRRLPHAAANNASTAAIRSPRYVSFALHQPRCCSMSFIR